MARRLAVVVVVAALAGVSAMGIKMRLELQKREADLASKQEALEKGFAQVKAQAERIEQQRQAEAQLKVQQDQAAAESDKEYLERQILGQLQREWAAQRREHTIYTRAETRPGRSGGGGITDRDPDYDVYLDAKRAAVAEESNYTGLVNEYVNKYGQSAWDDFKRKIERGER